MFFESEAWIWWNWINKMPLYWLFFICRGVNLLKYFSKTIFLIWNSRFQKSNQGHPSYDAIYKAVIFYYWLNTLFLQSKWPKWPQKMTKSHDESSILTQSAGLSKEITSNISVLYSPNGHTLAKFVGFFNLTIIGHFSNNGNFGIGHFGHTTVILVITP